MISEALQQSVQHDTTVVRSSIAVGSRKTMPSSWLCFLASAVASASLIMPPERSLAASRGAAKRMETLMQEIRVLGHLPRWTKEAPLALRLKRAKASEELSASQLAELEAMPAFSKRVTGTCRDGDPDDRDPGIWEMSEEATS